MVYLDYNATSKIFPEILPAVTPVVGESFGNPSSLHAAGRRAREGVESVRRQLLEALGDREGQLVFTSGGTEADNLALRGVIGAFCQSRAHLVVSSVEHEAVLHTARRLEEEGVEVSVVPVDSQGVVDLRALERAVTPRTRLISVMHANNEVGTLQPVEEVGRIARRHGVLFHTDAVQSFGKVPLDVKSAGCDLLSLSAHKFGGFKGAGALYVKKGTPLAPILFGGPHEHNLRGGTEGVPGIAAMGEALRLTRIQREMGMESRIGELRDRLEMGLQAALPDVWVNGHPEKRIFNTLNVSFAGCRAQDLLMALDMAGICASSGAACSSGSAEPSHVLAAMGLPPERVQGAVRFSLGWGTTSGEIEECLEKIPHVVRRVRRVKHAAR